MNILYLILAFIATCFGAMAGLGGGVIIKPVLDALGSDPIGDISMLSSATVFSMALVATFRQMQNGFKLEKRMLFLVGGATIGGILGKFLFTTISINIPSNTLKGSQALILAILLTIVLFKNRLPDWEIKSKMIAFILGVMLGTLASFLGIGGGPINVAILCMFLSLNVKDAAIISILIILFSQGAKLTMIQIDTGFSAYQSLHKLWYMIPGGVIGGLVGSKLNRQLSHTTIERFFFVVIVVIIILNIFNAVIAFQ